jgi:hypothetical protein
MSSTIEEWFEAFARRDHARARELFADDSLFHVLGDGPLAGDYRGVDGLLALVDRRRELTVGTFSYEVHDLLQNPRHAVALLWLHAMIDGVQHTWRQVAVYELASSRITEIWAFEEPGAPV